MQYPTSRKGRGFTLIELITAMVITSLLVLVIMQLTNQAIDLWNTVREDVSTSSRSRAALQTMAMDLQSFQLRTGDNKYEWMTASRDNAPKGAPKGLAIPQSARFVFFACAPDRNPAVSNTKSLRLNYREARAHNLDTQGDVNAICYSLKYHDQILNLPGSSSGDSGTFPLFSLYRNVVPPREAYEKLLGKTDLDSAYRSVAQEDEKHFLCENIVEMNLILNILYSDGNADIKTGRSEYASLSVPIISSQRRGGSKVSVYGDRIEVDGRKYENAHIVSADLSICVLTEEGAAVAEQVRQGRRRAPKAADFFARYTRSYTCAVALPSPV